MWEHIEILYLSQEREEEIILCQNQIIMLQDFSPKKLLAIEMEKAQIVMNKPV